jgi:hypothetical protein
MKRILEIIGAIDPMVKTKENPFFKSKYFDINNLIEVLRPIFLAKKLVIMQPLININGLPAIETSFRDTETGEVVYSSIFPLPNINEPQKMGAAITYYRRHSLKSMLFLEEVDDDGSVKEKKLDNVSALKKLGESKTKAELNEVWKKLSQKERNDKEVIELAKELQAKFKKAV